jgi:hypothetical protein
MKEQKDQRLQKPKRAPSLLVLVISFILLFVLCAIGMLMSVDWEEVKANPSAYATQDLSDW